MQANLEAYLERKRIAFPRFYFLANDDLLDILSKNNDPAAVAPYLHKLFDGISALQTEGEGRSMDVLGLVSAEGERMTLLKLVRARGPAEGACTPTQMCSR